MESRRRSEKVKTKIRMKIKQYSDAHERISGVVNHTPLTLMRRLSKSFSCNIYFKREDLQTVRSYKIRGAYNKIAHLEESNNRQLIVCASAGNHAQGVAEACRVLQKQGIVFMPLTTPKQKVKQVEHFGECFIKIVLEGDTFDDAFQAAHTFSEKNNGIFVHPFDDLDVIAGQGTIGLEILEDLKTQIDVLLFPIGGGGLAAGLCDVFKHLSPKTKLIGVEPSGAPSMQEALKSGQPVELKSIDKFVDGAAVKKVGSLNFEIAHNKLDQVLTVNEGKVCSTILQMYNEEGIVLEPAGALCISALDQLHNLVKNKNVVCIISGGNNDINRTEEIRERALIYEGRKHYFLVEFPQRPGVLKAFVTNVLGENDDITYFQFVKKHSKETGPAVIGIELSHDADVFRIKEKLDALKFEFKHLNEDALLLSQMIG